jgi:hypothetical protein
MVGAVPNEFEGDWGEVMLGSLLALGASRATDGDRWYFRWFCVAALESWYVIGCGACRGCSKGVTG